MTRSAEAWLAEQGVARQPIGSPAPDARAAGTGERAAAASHDAVAPPPPPVEENLEDQVARAVAQAHRITSQAPQSEARLRGKLAQRGHTEVVIGLALERCRSQGIVDDRAMAAALVDERRRKGHAPARIRQDLAGRGFADEILDELLAPAESEDQGAAAFDVASRRAPHLRGLEPEAALRRLVGYLARRGYPEALSRKVARDVLSSSAEGDLAAGWADREHQRAAER